MQAKKVVEPFGEVNCYMTTRNTWRVTATILMESRREGTQTGIALDGSSSMRMAYGFGPTPMNVVSPVAKRITSYLAGKLDADGGTTFIYWATGERGDEIEVVGDLKSLEALEHPFGPPKNFGDNTQLLPAVKYFAERFADAPWGFYVFITDGSINDLGLVKSYTCQLARDIAAGKRNPVKLVLIGVGPDINEEQMEELDDLYTGTHVDLWDHKIAREMRVLQEIFAEVVDKNVRVADHGKIMDADGRLIKDYAGDGLPAFLEFEVRPETKSFTLEVNGVSVTQDLPNPIVRPTPPPPRIAVRKQPVAAPQSRRGCLLLFAPLMAPLIAAIWRGLGGR
jgi:hypothetical protein